MKLERNDDLLYKFIAFANRSWEQFFRRLLDLMGSDIWIRTGRLVYCRTWTDAEVLALDDPNCLYRPCDCEKAFIQTTSTDLFYGGGWDLGQGLTDWLKEKKGIKVSWGVDRGGCYDWNTRWHFEVNDTRLFDVYRVDGKEAGGLMGAAWRAFLEMNPEFDLIIAEYREDRYKDRGWPAIKARITRSP